MTDVQRWLQAFAEEIGQPLPDEETVARVLQLAGVAAHASARQAAPVACWMAGVAGLDLDEAIRRADELVFGP